MTENCAQTSDTLPSCILVDLDGTLALNRSGRSHNPGPGGEDRVGEDLPNKPIVELVTILSQAGHRVIFMSGRTGACRPETCKWLAKNLPDVWFANGLNWDIHMRAVGDFRSDSVVKRELYEKHIKDKYRVFLILDDRDSVVRLWRSLGLTCLQVAEGNF